MADFGQLYNSVMHTEESGGGGGIGASAPKFTLICPYPKPSQSQKCPCLIDKLKSGKNIYRE